MNKYVDDVDYPCQGTYPTNLEIMQALKKYGPLGVEFCGSSYAFKSKSLSKQVINCKTYVDENGQTQADTGCDKDTVSHGGLLVGFDKTSSGKKYWVIKNSWGVGWGDKGFGYIEMMDEDATDGHGACNINFGPIIFTTRTTMSKPEDPYNGNNHCMTCEGCLTDFSGGSNCFSESESDAFCPQSPHPCKSHLSNNKLTNSTKNLKCISNFDGSDNELCQQAVQLQNPSENSLIGCYVPNDDNTASDYDCITHLDVCKKNIDNVAFGSDIQAQYLCRSLDSTQNILKQQKEIAPSTTADVSGTGGQGTESSSSDTVLKVFLYLDGVFILGTIIFVFYSDTQKSSVV